ncbi:Late blight resistance protein like [Actinidia chinensis var. chinensis]|uniref:Late blight resistance protein like n=1 Tax=Actinidia chinensis var. chinensis TaxID=1590841 RepID=A0A2R6RXV8_ACTCC|nr:Late blight resistance protein like [Actinidia chinensis var. chinensis]
MLKSLTAETLPASISNLWNLHTLVVTAPCINRPQLNIWKMKELWHLHFHGQLLLPEPPKKAKDDSDNALSNLLTLSCLSPDSCTTSVLSMMPNLLKLGIHGNLDQLRLSGTFDNLSVPMCLQTLKLERDRRCNELDSLEYFVFPQSLVKLATVETQLLVDPMGVLGQLPNLQALKLKNAYIGQELHCGQNLFPKLQVLKLVNLAIRSWTIAQGAMPNLRSVLINRCEPLEGLPSAL